LNLLAERTCFSQVVSLGAAAEMLDARRLHTHFGQDGGMFNERAPPKFYGVMSLCALLLSIRACPGFALFI
jgi:hypothetical protein